MRGPRFVLQFLPLVAVVLALATSRAADDNADYVVIVHPDSAVVEVSRSFLRDAYLKKRLYWPDGDRAIRPIDLSNRFAERKRFTREVLKKSASQLKTYWNQLIFSGKGTPPPEAGRVADVIKYVVANPGAVGYVPAAADRGRTKIVKVK